MARMTADTVTRQLKKVLEDKMSLVLDSKTSDKVRYTITYNKNNAQIKAFFDLSSQLYGFEMFNKGIKTYDKIDIFAEMLNIYLYINTELIPVAQQVVELYSQENGLTTKYITFTGNLTDGFTTQFEVAGEARFVFVTEQDEDVYRLTLVESQDKKKYKTLDMYLYLRQPNGTFEKRFMLLSAANKLFERCFDLGEDYSIKRTETNNFVFSYGDLTVEFSLNISDVIEYVIHSVNEEEKEFSFILDDFLDLDAFITAVLDRIGGKLGGTKGIQIPNYDNADSNKIITEEPDAVSVDDIDFEDSEDSTENIETTENVEDTMDITETTDNIDLDEADINKELNSLDTEIDSSDDIEGTEIDLVSKTDIVESDSSDKDLNMELDNLNNSISEVDNVDSTEENTNTEITEDTTESVANINEETVSEQDSDIETEEVSDTQEEIENETKEIEDETKEIDYESKDFEEETQDNVEETQETEDNNIVEETTEKEGTMETEQIATVDLSTVDEDSISVSKLMRDNVLVGLLFNVDNKLYIADIDSLKDYRIPYKRLVDEEVEVKKKGYALWESESKLKTFADDISDNTEFIKQLIDLMF